MDRILEGKKTIELKKASDFWKKRLEKYVGKHSGDLGINFLCGQKSHKFKVPRIEHRSFEEGDDPILIDESYELEYFAIFLGQKIDGEVEER